MKKHSLALLVAALVAASGFTTAFAQGTFQMRDAKIQFQVGQTAAGVDTVSIVGMTTTTVLTATKDTTLWVRAGDIKLSQPGFTAAPILQGYINASTAVAADSVGYQIQWSSGPDQTKLQTTSQAYVVMGSDSQKLFNIVIPDAAAVTGTRFRIILWANDTGGVVHTYSIGYVYRGMP